jgi:glycosyltransferase involved in cell wall biosynthesis
VNPLRIAVFHNLPSGGAKRALYNFMRLLGEMGHHLDLHNLTTSEEQFLPLAPFAKQVFTADFRWIEPRPRANVVVKLVNLTRLAAASRVIAHSIDNGEYDLAFVHHCRFVQTPLVLSYLRTPSVYYCEEPLRRLYEPQVQPYQPADRSLWTRRMYRKYMLALADRIYDRLLKRLERRNAQAANLVLANSYYSRETLYRVLQVTARVNYLGVDCDIFRPTDVGRERCVVSVGALHPRKGHDFVIRALSLVPEQIRPSMVIVADRGGEVQEYLQAYAADHAVELRIMMGVSDEKLVDLYNRAKALLYAPLLEPFGLVALEAMACGTPVIAVKEAGIRETVRSGETGILTERSEEDLAQAIETLLSDESMLRVMGKQARHYACHDWTWERSVAQLVANLRRVTELPPD